MSVMALVLDLAGSAMLLVALVSLFLTRDAELEEAMARLGCPHAGEVEVRLSTGQHAADWCPECGRTAYRNAWIMRGE